MLKSILNAANDVVNTVSIDSLVLDILIIIGLVVAGALIVYFVWEALCILLGKNKDHSQANPETYYAQPQKKEKEVFVANYTLDENKEDNLIDEDKLEEVDQAQANKEKSEAEAKAAEEEREIAERRAYLEARRRELINRMQAQMQEQAEEDEKEEDEEEAEEEEQSNNQVAADNAAKVEETSDEDAEDAEDEADDQEDEQQKAARAAELEQLEEVRRALAEEKARYAAMVKELENAKNALEQQKIQEGVSKQVATTTVVNNTVVTKNGALTLEELREKLAEAEQRLRDTEKEFKQCKKEYTPLRRIWANHERDERKLRRKEALVAKQKVILYGVNNYADIDEERAKKLAEDLDHLDGLKLSVQHCEEVMKENADRYPLLEKMYGVLSQRNEELKRDIAYYKAEIARLESEENDQ